MDPIATINRMLDALSEDDVVEGRATFEDLLGWAQRDGYMPKVIDASDFRLIGAPRQRGR